jgi:hypothetical protein
MSISFTNSVDMSRAARGLAPLCAGAGAYLFSLFIGDALLQDSDSFWQIKIGQWIIDHNALPHSDFYSFTHFGEPWISSSWLSQVLYALSFAWLGWTGPVILTCLALAATAAILVHLLDRHFEPVRSGLFTMAALLLSLYHLLARPHILALPVMVAWVGALMAAADRRSSPSFLLLPLIALWANLHGGFVLGLALIGPIALEATFSAEPARRVALFGRWVLFGFAALAASCFTPYGWNTLFAAARILDLGELLHVISEWQPANFASFTSFEAAVLGLLGFAFYRGLVLSWPRVLLILGLTWMALTHVRSIEAFAFLVPLVLAKPIAGGARAEADSSSAPDGWTPPYVTLLAALAIFAGGLSSTALFVAHHPFLFTTNQTPAAAVDVLKEHRFQRIFNGYQFGGYLIGRDVPVFVDGRAELYGEKFVMDFFKAVEGKKLDMLAPMLDQYRIDATLLGTASPAVTLLDHMPGWKRLYGDDIAVVHVRTAQPADAASR